MGKNIPGLNFDGKLAIQDFKFWDIELEKAILDRFNLVMGGRSLPVAHFGIADAVDPKNLVETETTRPLIVYPSPNNPLLINVAPGLAVAPNGSIIGNPALLEDEELARTSANDIVIVYLENEIVDGAPVRNTVYNIAQPVRRVQNTGVIRSALIADFTNAVIFTPERRENIVVIAVVTVANTVAGLQLQIDYSNNTYLFNRPWFSPVDVEHRSQIGSGTPTTRNVHGLTFNDLVSGSLTLYDQLLKYGCILALDEDIKGISGKLCFEDITVSRVLTDGSGAITAGSRFGGTGAKYIVLASYPVGISAFYLQSHKGYAVAFDHIAGTRILVLPNPEQLTGTATIQYNQVFAGMPPASILSNTLTFTQPDTARELISTGGVSISTLTNPSIDFDGSGPVPRNYSIFVTGTGGLIRTPQLIQSTFKLDDLGTSLQTITFSIFGPAKIGIGLADANPVPTMQITIKVFGKNKDGITITEDVTFSGTTWVNVALPGAENPNQFIKTTQIFYSITNLQVTNRTDDGPNSRIVLWAELETETTQDLNKLALLAKVRWDGTAATNLIDARKIVSNLPANPHRFIAAAEVLGLGGSVKNMILSEDFSNPRYRDTTKGLQAPVAASFSIFIDDYTLIQAGDQIQLPTGSIITAITTGIPNRTIGEYLAAVSDSDTRDDMVLTINYGAFNSGITAVADGSNVRKVNCSANTLGARGNGTVVELVEGNPTAISLSGNALGGIDGFGESFTPRHYDNIDSPVPSPSTYEVYTIRERYLSTPIAIAALQVITVVIHGAQPPRPVGVQVRMRVASDSDPTWLPWEVATFDGAVFSISKAFNISKVQVEIFGKCSGFSLYESN